MSGFEQLLAHLWGDYILQSDWMAQNKTKSHLAAAVHAITYSFLFLFFRPSLAAFAVILSTHFLIDRYRLARYVVWLKNWIGPSRPWWIVGGKWFDVFPMGAEAEHFAVRPIPPLGKCVAGYPPDTPVWMATWLLIIADNILHLTINYLALRYLA